MNVEARFLEKHASCAHHQSRLESSLLAAADEGISHSRISRRRSADPNEETGNGTPLNDSAVSPRHSSPSNRDSTASPPTHPRQDWLHGREDDIPFSDEDTLIGEVVLVAARWPEPYDDEDDEDDGDDDQISLDELSLNWREYRRLRVVRTFMVGNILVSDTTH